MRTGKALGGNREKVRHRWGFRGCLEDLSEEVTLKTRWRRLRRKNVLGGERQAKARRQEGLRGSRTSGEAGVAAARNPGERKELGQARPCRPWAGI